MTAAIAIPAITPLFLVIGDFLCVELEVDVVEKPVKVEVCDCVGMDDGVTVCVWMGEESDIAVWNTPSGIVKVPLLPAQEHFPFASSAPQQYVWFPQAVIAPYLFAGSIKRLVFIAI